MALCLREQVAIIVGSSMGVGRAIALVFAQEGASVTVCAR
jgi:NAD(P)-dependent dehydrogenase (short-subunit alcohol dehydrogenase family)